MENIEIEHCLGKMIVCLANLKLDHGRSRFLIQTKIKAETSACAELSSFLGKSSGTGERFMLKASPIRSRRVLSPFVIFNKPKTYFFDKHTSAQTPR